MKSLLPSPFTQSAAMTLAVPDPRHRHTPLDQAHGLRQRFAGQQCRFVPLVHNPQVASAGVVMERLCAAFGAQGLRTLVVDAADSASPPHQLATVDLAACIETLSSQVSYLAARGLPMHYLDNRATMAGFLEALRMAAGTADVVLLHAGALDMRRIFAGRAPRPVLLADDRADSLTQAYGAMKLLSQRLGALSYDLVVADDVSAARAQSLGERLADCADHFLGAALRRVAQLDPQSLPTAPLRADLCGLAIDQLASFAATGEHDHAHALAALTSLPVLPAAMARQRRPAQPAAFLELSGAR